MLDVHPPHESVHGWRDFLLHLLTITIGLLIALSLEGLVEWQHHRHLVHEAEQSLRTEINSNADDLKDIAADIQKQQAELQHDLAILNMNILHQDVSHEHMSVAYHLSDLDDVSWKTAQSTGALSYMRYSEAEEYSAIYSLQHEFDIAQHQALRDAILTVAPFASGDPKSRSPTPEQAAVIRDHMQVLMGQLLLVDSLVKSLGSEYQKFLNAHPLTGASGRRH